MNASLPVCLCAAVEPVSSSRRPLASVHEVLLDVQALPCGVVCKQTLTSPERSENIFSILNKAPQLCSLFLLFILDTTLKCHQV